ncbi:hypothetical protein [Aquitalea sp. LB_tupeE]|uniref:hypothetical protein n=1 Tax=Aquitalea sp. LB_tupeE TaxID=2748078 RepID=UPI0015B92166|nr:hypothetical protein [Aquitalea sp. LB_tupeE]NWK79199.1 hypothetical protein [Aquitalea sp. LB_tupeE]
MRVADHTLVLPRVAVRNPGAGGQRFSLATNTAEDVAADAARQRLRDASAPAAALELPRLNILIQHYGWEEYIPQSQAFCSQLRRQWSRALCNNASPALIQALSNNEFSLLAWPLAPEVRASVWGANCLPAGQALPDLPVDGQAIILCRLSSSSKENPLFHAVVRIDESLAATWVVWPEAKTGETAAAKAQREGQAMIALVQLGLGPEEDFARLHQRMCQLQRPAAKGSSDRPDCP